MEDKRKYNRRLVKAKIRLVHDTFGTLEAVTRDISDGGVFINLAVSPPFTVGDAIKLHFLDSAEPEAIFHATLIRVVDRGIALNFVDYEVAGVRRKIDELRAEYLAKQSAAG